MTSCPCRELFTASHEYAIKKLNSFQACAIGVVNPDFESAVHIKTIVED